MACPICGANCQCHKRGAGGICCSCHPHKARRILISAQLTPEGSMAPEIRDALQAHLLNIQEATERGERIIEQPPTRRGPRFASPAHWGYRKRRRFLVHARRHLRETYSYDVAARSVVTDAIMTIDIALSKLEVSRRHGAQRVGELWPAEASPDETNGARSKPGSQA